MKNTFLILLSVLVFAAGPAWAGSVKSEEEFDLKAGLFKRIWKQAPQVAHFSSPVPAQVRAGLPPWSQQPLGAQATAPQSTGTPSTGTPSTAPTSSPTGFFITPGP